MIPMRKMLPIMLIIVLVVLPLYASDFLRAALILSLLYLSLAEFWSFMTKHAGIVFLGSQMFIGIGSYFTAVLCMYFSFPLWAGVIISGLIGCTIATLLSFPLLRLRGFYFAIGTLVAAEIVKLLFIGWEYVGAGLGLIFRTAYGISSLVICYPSLVLAVASVFLVNRLYYSKLGFGLRSLGQDEENASALGVNPFRCRALCFIISCLFASFVGGIYAIYRPYIEPVSTFSILWTTRSLFISIVGGIGTIAGPIIGSIIYVVLEYVLAQYLGLSLLIQGVIVLAFLMAFPQGLWGFISRKFKAKI